MAKKPKLFKGFPGVYEIGKKQIATKNLVPGVKIYNEKIVRIGKDEYRIWNPYRSKLAAALLNGLKYMEIKPGTRVLYLGSATGTTPSHVSDILNDYGKRGICYCVEFSPRMMKEFILRVARYRKNVIPILADARMPELYAHLIPEKVDVVYQDIAQPEQASVLVKNARFFLKEGGYVYLAIKARSIDVTARPEEIYEKEINTLKQGNIRVLQVINLKPYEKDHVMVVGRFEP